MRFNVLGSLEVVDDGVTISLGGPKKRAALGYLLLHPNEVVATSRLISVLWPAGAPPTARKMVQNMVSDLRTLLAAHGRDGQSPLRTHSPGYLFRAEADELDLLDFQRLARSGRDALARGSWARAADLLGRACRLWRGSALADVADAGVDWPKLTALREAQLTTLEDYFEAELAAGHHYDHLAELDRLVAAEPHRERACRQLMLALYRCGRQVDALDTYQRTSAVLMAKFGLEPTRELRDMEQAILRHDATLSPSPEPARTARPPTAHQPVSERKLISVLTVAFERRPAIDRAETDDLLAELGAAVRDELTNAGAVVLGRTGSLQHGVFGVPRTDELDTLAAVRTALAIRDRFTGIAEVRAIVCTTEALVTFLPAAPAVVSPAIDESLRLIWTVPPGQVWACEATRCGSGAEIEYAPGAPPLWCVQRIGPGEPIADWPLVDRDHELAVLREHVDQVTRRGRGRLVTVVGEAGTGKTRLVADLVRTIEVPVAHIRVLRHGSLALPEPERAVLVVEDLHNADDDLLRQFGALAERTRTEPLLVIATARPDLFERGRFLAPASTTIVLDRLSDDAVRELWASVLGEDARPAPELVERIGGNPLFAVEFARHRRDAPPEQVATLPPTVYRTIAAELDGLPAADKLILRQATLVPDPIDPDSLAAVGGQDVDEARRGLDALARRHLLRRRADSAGYEFAQPLVREVAHAQLPRSARTPRARGHGDQQTLME